MVWKTRKDRPQNTGTASVYVMSIQEHGPIVQALLRIGSAKKSGVTVSAQARRGGGGEEWGGDACIAPWQLLLWKHVA